MDLSDWRARIDTVDRILLDLINRRLEYAVEIGRIKRAHGREVRDEQREREVIGLIAAGLSNVKIRERLDLSR